MTDRELAAYHEAGHATVARAFGVRVVGVAVYGGRGHTAHGRCSPAIELRIALGGIEAEQRVLGAAPWEDAESADALARTVSARRAGEDLVRVYELVRGDIDEFHTAIAEVRDVLERRWADVIAEAGSLVASENVIDLGAELERVFSRSKSR